MGLFYKPKYVGYCFLIRDYREGLEFQDSVVRDANSQYNLDLQEPFTYQGNGHITVSYNSNYAGRKDQVMVYVTDSIVLIGFEYTIIYEDQVMKVANRIIQEFSSNGIPIKYHSTTKVVNNYKLYEYMDAVTILQR